MPTLAQHVARGDREIQGASRDRSTKRAHPGQPTHSSPSTLTVTILWGRFLARPALSVLADGADEGDLLVAHEELSPSLPEWNPIRCVSTLSLQEQVEFLFHGVALVDGYRVVLSIQQRDFQVHRNGD